GGRRLRDHRHEDPDDIALLNPQRLEDVREALRRVEEVGVGDVLAVAVLTHPMERDLVAPAGLDVAVEAVVRGVELALLEPLGPRRVPLEHRLPRLEPVELLGPALPPGLEVL